MSDRIDPVQFVDDEDGYLRWLAENPSGFVVNSHRSPVADYLVLHRASCRWINTGARNNWTTTGYIKTCSASVPPLVAWAARVATGRLQPCGACKAGRPGGGRAARPDRPASGAVGGGDAEVPRSAPTPDRPPHPAGTRVIPPTIATGCPELDRAWAAYAEMILHRSQILIPDTDEDLTWHAFLGHSIDMQGFRAAEFAGVDPLTRKAPGFVPLNRRGIGVPELAQLWEVPEIRRHLTSRLEAVPLDVTLGVLLAHGGPVGESLADAFAGFPWRKFHWSVRALLENSAALRPHAFSFRSWLAQECERLGVGAFPPDDFRRPVLLEGARTTLESALRDRLRRAFYMVGPAMSAYMLCDWQLWLWREGRTAVFANFKLDSFHEAFLRKFGGGAIPADEAGFARWWLDLFPGLPPRLANECIWLAVEHKQVDPW